MTEEELDQLHRQLPSLPVGWEPVVADLIAEVRRLQGERERLAAQWGLLKIDLHRCQKGQEAAQAEGERLKANLDQTHGRALLYLSERDAALAELAMLEPQAEKWRRRGEELEFELEHLRGEGERG